MKKKCSPAQLRALKKGRLTRKRKLREKKKKNKPKKKRKMTKRRRTNTSLTGGTGDINPQLWSGIAKMSVVNQPATSGFITPISRLPKSGNRVTVMEILKIYVWMAPTNIVAAGETYQNIHINFGTKDRGIAASTADEPSIFAYLRKNYLGAFTAGGSYGKSDSMPLCVDLTDGIGHGILLATDYLYVQADTHNYGAIQSIPFKILYRFKNVSLTEYIGIVQSQQ